MTSYGDSGLGQHCLREWPVAWRHQAITWTNVDLWSVRCFCIHLIGISQKILEIFIAQISLKFPNLMLYSNPPGANELTDCMMTSSNGNIFRVTGPLCGNSPVPSEFPPQRPLTRRFNVFFDLRLNKWLSKQLWGWWFETLPCPL